MTRAARRFPLAGPAPPLVTCGVLLGTLVLVVGLAALARAQTSAPTSTPSPAILVVVDGDSGPYRQAVAGAKARAPSAQVVSVAEGKKALTAAPEGTRLVALGPRAARLLAEVRPGRGAAALVQASDVPKGLSHVALEVPLSVQAGWLKQAFPGRSRLVVLGREGGTVDDEALKAAAQAHDLTLDVVDVGEANEAVFALERALRRDRQRAVVWLLADPGVITGETVAPLTQVALSARVPVVGFSSYFLKAGALGAVRTDFGKMGEAAVELAEQAAGGAPTTTLSPPGAHLALNERLAERLGIVLGSGPSLERIR